MNEYEWRCGNEWTDVTCSAEDSNFVEIDCRDPQKFQVLMDYCDSMFKYSQERQNQLIEDLKVRMGMLRILHYVARLLGWCVVMLLFAYGMTRMSGVLVADVVFAVLLSLLEISGARTLVVDEVNRIHSELHFHQSQADIVLRIEQEMTHGDDANHDIIESNLKQLRRT